MFVVGFGLIVVILWEAFETIVLPRRVQRRLRLTSLVYGASWHPYARLARSMPVGKRRESFVGFFGPLSLLLLLAFWAAGLVVGFAVVYWSLDAAVHVPDPPVTFATYLYASGVCFFTLGLGDVVPLDWPGRAGVVVEAGLGLGFLAMVISYLPVIYQAFSHREVSIALLDSRAGSPPSASELVARQLRDGRWDEVDAVLRDWERSAAELLESHLSYPILCFYRSQHDNQSWLGALTAILDTCALALALRDPGSARQAELTFAMARHAVVDLAQVFGTPPKPPSRDRLATDEFLRLAERLAAAGLALDGGEVERRLAVRREAYEPYVSALADYPLMPLPPWVPAVKARDNWQSSAWDRRD
jgi:hypothetical protein